MASTEGKIQQTNTFEGGMNSDFAPENIPVNEALDIRNLRVVSDNTSDNGFGNESGKAYRLQTQKGHELEFSIPNVPAISRWQVCWEIEDPAQEGSFVISVVATKGDCSDFIENQSVTFDPNGTNNLGSFIDELNTLGQNCGKPLTFAFVNCNCIFIYTTYVDVLITSVVVIAGPNTVVTVQPIDLPEQTDLEVIGQVSNGRELILFTTSAVNVDPFSSPTPNVGQIWQLDISKYNEPIQCTLDNLRFTDYINFALRNQIQAEYTVETDCIRRLTWTDNYNPVRTITLDEQTGLIVKVPDTLNLQPEVQYGTIDYIGFGSGTLLTGVYRAAYRYITADGNATPFTALSNPINVLNNATIPYIEYEGGGVNTPSQRSIILQLNNLDTRFATLQVVLCYYTTNASPPAQSFIVFDGGFGPNQTIEVFSNTTIYGNIAYEEVVDNPLQIDRVKNLLVSSNRLILSNYCVKTDIDISKVSWGAFDYTIRRVLADTRVQPPLSPPKTGFAVAPWANLERQSTDFYDTLVTGINSGFPDFTYANDFTDGKGSQTMYYVRTHPRGEVLRFGIQFTLKSGALTPVYYMADFTTPSVKVEPLSEIVDGNMYLRVLGIRIPNIDVSQIADEISGFSIVMAPVDRTIAGQGVLYNYGLSNKPEDYDIRFVNSFNTVGGRNSRRYALYSPDYDFLQDIKGELQLEVLGSLPNDTQIVVNTKQFIYKYYDFAAINATVVNPVISATVLANEQLPDSSGFRYGQYTHVLLPTTNTLSGLAPQSGPLLVNIRVVKNDLYGGTSDAALANTPYRSIGHYQSVSGCDDGVYTVDVFGGETFIANYDRIVRYLGGPITDDKLAGGIFCPIECHFNASLRESITIGSGVTQAQLTLLRRLSASPFNYNSVNAGPEPFIYEPVWTYSSSTFEKAIAKQETIGDCTVCFPTGIIPSAPKVYGELINSFGNLLESDAVQADVQYGEINQMLSLDRRQREVYIWQDTAFQYYPFGQQSLQVTTGQEVQTGTGTLFGPPVLISTSAGSLHKWSTIKGGDQFYWVSLPVRRIYSFGDSGLRDLTIQGNMRTWFESKLKYASDLDNPVFDGGYHAVYDYRHNEVLFTYRINPNNLPQDTVVDFYINNTCWGDFTRILLGFFNEVNYITAPIDFDGTPQGLIDALKTNPLFASFNYVLQDSGIIITGLPVSSVIDIVFGETIGSGENKVCRFDPYGDNVNWTIAWSELQAKFPSKWSFWPKIYIPVAGNRLLSPDPLNGSEVYQHAVSTLDYSTFYGVTYDCWIEYVLNKGGTINTKTPQSIVGDFNDLWSEIQCVTNYVRSSYGGTYRLKGQYPMIIFVPSNGKWVAEFLPANIIQPLGGTDTFIEPSVMLGELLFVRIVNKDSAYKDVGLIDTMLGISRTNRTSLR